MPELTSSDVGKVNFDAKWYLEAYPDVANAGIDPKVHYEAHGWGEGRFPRLLEAARLESAMWGGFAAAAVIELQAWWERTNDKDERAYASWALTRWYASCGNWSQALFVSHGLENELPPFLNALASILLRCEVLIKNRKEADARSLIERAILRFGLQPDLCLAAANICLPCGRNLSDNELRLNWLNTIFSEANLALLTACGQGPLSLDNLIALEGISTSSQKCPRISVIMPAFNAADFIVTAIKGVLAQTWCNLEVIVVDDCSDDATVNLVEKMAREDSRIVLIRQSKNMGAYAARNVGLKFATGDLVTNHDSDDWSHPQRLERMAQPLLDDQSLVGSVADWVRTDTALHFQHWRIETGLIHPSVSTLMVRTLQLQESGGWDEVRVAADNELYQRLIRAHGAGAIARILPGVPLVLARQVKTSLTMTSATHLRSMFFGLRRLYGELAETWHGRAGSPAGLKITNMGPRRSFPAPSPILHGEIQEKSYDWLIIGDLSHGAKNELITHTVINRVIGKGGRVALFHWPDYLRPAPVGEFYLRSALDELVEIVLAEQKLNAEQVVVVGRHLLAHPLDQVPTLLQLRRCTLIDGIWEAKTFSVESAHSQDWERQPASFDADWYLQRNPDVLSAGIDPWQHYLSSGAGEGREPNPSFNSVWYCQQYSQAAESDLPAFVHYLKFGRQRGYKSNHPQIFGRQPHLEGRPTILLCAHAADSQIFGAERCFIDILKALIDLRINVVATVPSVVNREYVEEIQRCVKCVVCIPTMPWKNHIPPCPIAIQRFEEVIGTFGVDLVHVNTIMLREPLLAARAAGVPAITHVHESPEHDPELCESIGTTPANIVSQALERSDFIFANSEFTARNFKKHRATFLVRNIVNSKEFQFPNKVDPSRITAAIISSNLPKKGLRDLQDLARELEFDVPNLELLLIGPNNSWIEELHQKMAEGTLPANIRIIPYSSSPQQAVAQTNIVMNLSLCQETFGRTILEGMAAGRPVLVYRWGGLPELINEGENGFSIKYRDVKTVAKKLRLLCRDPRKIIRMGEAGRERAMQYSQEQLCQQLIYAYGMVLNYPVDKLVSK